MKRVVLLVLVTLAVLPGCGTTRSPGWGIANWILPGTNDLDNSRRFWDQTSDNPHR